MSVTKVNFNNRYSCIKLHDTDYKLHIIAFQRQLENSRINDMKKNLQYVSEIRKYLESLKMEICKINFNETLNGLRKKLLELEEKIIILKKKLQTEFIDTMKSESVLVRHLKLFESRIEDWEKPCKIQMTQPVDKVKNIKIKFFEKSATEKFQIFLSKNGGHCGGWLEHDHLLFLKEVKKNNSPNHKWSTLQKLLPDLSYIDFVKHSDWYTQYITLKESQREAIKNWKLGKLNKDKEIENSEPENLTELKPKEKNAPKKQITVRINEWKKQKLAKKSEDEKRNVEEKKKVKEGSYKLRQMQRIKKNLVDQYKVDKLRKVQLSGNVKKEMNPNPKDKIKHNILLKHFRQQDEEFIKKKKIHRLRSESRGKRETESKLEFMKHCSIDLFFVRDPHRLLKPTFIWNQHCQASEKTERFFQISDLQNICRRAIPEWRRELK